MRKCGRSKPVIERVAARSGAGVLDDCFAAKVDHDIIPVDWMGS